MRNLFLSPSRGAGLFSVLLLAGLGGRPPASVGDGERERARQVLAVAGLRGGLILHVGCGDGALTAALGEDARFVVQGLDADPERVRRCRERLRREGLLGRVSADRFDGKRLPYAEDLANLVVAEDLGGVPIEEALRVLAPGGSLCVGKEGRWERTVKPRPPDIDEWTHFLHDSGGNPVARDRRVGPPRGVQWIAGPRHMRSHEHTPNLQALVASGGRLFFVADEAPCRSILDLPRWHLTARDAFNGILLWRRPIESWWPHLINWGASPEMLQRRVVASGDRLYATLGFTAPVSVLEAATGEILGTLGGTEGAEEILLHRNVLLAVCRNATPAWTAELGRWDRLVREGAAALRTREDAQPHLDRLREAQNAAPRRLVAVEAGTGRLLWSKEGRETAGLRPLGICASGDRVFLQRGREVAAVDLKTGREVWAVPAPRLALACDEGVVCAEAREIALLSAETGKTLWTRSGPMAELRDAFVISGSLWLGGFGPWEGPVPRGSKRGPAWTPYLVERLDLATGKTLSRIAPENPGHHHRCWRNKATERYILSGRRGVEFVDLQRGEVLWHSWIRGVCRYGILPCNGLLYVPPHACGCYIAAKLTGFYALSPRPGSEVSRGTPVAERGPAFGEVKNPSRDTGGDWPTYRGEASRSGVSRSPVPPALRPRWEEEVGGRLSAPTVAGGRVFVASVDRHEVQAREADTGRLAWSFTAGARVDSPPTLHEGRVLFGGRDGCVYSLRMSDGVLDWRLPTRGADRRIVAEGQVESASPVPGSVLVQDGVLWCTAGRSSYLDGGIELYRIQPSTGRVLSVTPLYSPDPATGRQPPQRGPAEMPGALADILTGGEGNVYLRDLTFDRDGAPAAAGRPHLFTLTGFLDDTWPHRSYWIYGTRCSLSTGCSSRDKDLIYGRILVFDEGAVYGYGRESVHWSNMLEDGPYRLFARRREGKGAVLWSRPVEIEVRALVLAGPVLFAAGPPAGGGRGAMLLALSAADGAEVGRCPLQAPPVFDGMAAAGGRLFLSLVNGRLLCLDRP